MFSFEVVHISIIEPDPAVVAIRIHKLSGGENCDDESKQLCIGEEEEGGKHLDSIITTQSGGSGRVVTSNYDDCDQQPNIERKQKLEPGLDIGSQTIIETGFNTKIQIKPRYECAKK